MSENKARKRERKEPLDPNSGTGSDSGSQAEETPEEAVEAAPPSPPAVVAAHYRDRIEHLDRVLQAHRTLAPIVAPLLPPDVSAPPEDLSKPHRFVDLVRFYDRDHTDRVTAERVREQLKNPDKVKPVANAVTQRFRCIVEDVEELAPFIAGFMPEPPEVDEKIEDLAAAAAVAYRLGIEGYLALYELKREWNRSIMRRVLLCLDALHDLPQRALAEEELEGMGDAELRRIVRHRIMLSIRRGVVWVNGKPHPYNPNSKGLKVFEAIMNGLGAWVFTKDIKSHADISKSKHPGKYISSLPKELQSLIESQTGIGYRLRLDRVITMPAVSGSTKPEL